MTTRTTRKIGTVSMDQLYLKADVDAASFVRAVAGLGALADELRLRFDEDGITASAVNPSHTVLGGIDLPAEYQTDTESVTVGVNAERLESAATFFDMADDTTTLRLDDGEDRMTLLHGNYMDEVQLIDPEDVREEPDTPTFEYSTTATIDGLDFKAAVGAVTGKGTQSVRLSIGGSFTAEASERGKGYIHEWSADAETSGRRMQQTVGQSFLSDVAAAVSPGDDVTLRLEESRPVRIETDSLWFVIAPRLEEGEDE